MPTLEYISDWVRYLCACIRALRRSVETTVCHELRYFEGMKGGRIIVYAGYCYVVLCCAVLADIAVLSCAICEGGHGRYIISGN